MKKYAKKIREQRKSRKGFTLVELIVVLVILAILAAMMVPTLTGWIEKAKEKKVALEARSTYLAVQMLASEGYVKSPATRAGITREKIFELASLTDNSQKILVFYKSNSSADELSKDYYTVVGLRYSDKSDVTFEIGDVSGDGQSY